MLYCIIFGILIFLIVSLSFVIETNMDGDVSITSLIASALIILALYLPLYNDTKGEVIECETVQNTISGLELKQREGDRGIQGRFCLGFGHINTISSDKANEYVFFVNNNYGKKLESLPVANVYIRETDEEEPKIIKIETKKQRIANWIDRLWGHHKGEKITRDYEIKGYILVVPTDTIQIDYNIEV